MSENYKYGFVTDIENEAFEKGLNEDIIRRASKLRGEPQFMLDFRLKAYESRNLDAASKKIIETASKHGAKKIVGPVPLPTDREVVTVLRAVHKYKDSREQFEIRTHKRLIEIIGPTAETVDAMGRMDLPSGVDVEIKM